MVQNVEEYMDELILLRKKAVAVEVFRDRIVVLRRRLDGFSTLAPQSHKPSMRELAIREPLATLLMQDLQSGSTEVISSLSDETLVALGRECETEATAYLRHLLPAKKKGKATRKDQGKAQDEDTTDGLLLATTYFKCAKCTEPMPYARALVHHCLFASEQEVEEDDTTISLATMLTACASAVTPFYHPDSAGEKVFFDEEASRHAEILIRACGLDPRNATFADMESLNVRVECVPCSKKQRLGMGWRTAVRGLVLSFSCRDQPSDTALPSSSTRSRSTTLRTKGL